MEAIISICLITKGDNYWFCGVLKCYCCLCVVGKLAGFAFIFSRRCYFCVSTVNITTVYVIDVLW